VRFTKPRMGTRQNPSPAAKRRDLSPETGARCWLSGSLTSAMRTPSLHLSPILGGEVGRERSETAG